MRVTKWTFLQYLHDKEKQCKITNWKRLIINIYFYRYIIVLSIVHCNENITYYSIKRRYHDHYRDAQKESHIILK